MDAAAIDIICVSISALLMAAACYFDIRFREIPDRVWALFGIVGIAMTAVRISDSFRWEYAMMLAGMLMILADILIDFRRSAAVSVLYYMIMAALFIVPVILNPGDGNVKMMLVVPACSAAAYILYQFNVINGGADAKCLMVMGMMFQTYPAIGCMPLIRIPGGDIGYIFAFPIALLFHAALFSFVWLFYTVIRKIYRREGPVQMFTLSWYMMSVEDAKHSFVWPKQDVVDGYLVNVRGMPDEGVFERLEKAGVKNIWVTPMIPFMVPLTVAMIFLFTVGSLLFIPFSL